MNALNRISQSSEHKESPKFTVSFDLNGGFGYLNPLVIETSEKSALVNLPSKTEVASAVSKIGFELENFKDLANGMLYEFSQTISISTNFTLSIVWKEIKGEDDRRKDDKGQESSLNSNEDVRGTRNSYIKSQFPVYHQYDSFGEKAARVSGNLSSLGVVGHLMAKNTASRQLVSVNLNPKISDIAPSCFAECRNLAYIDAGNKVKSVGDYAFYNCSSLSGVSFLASENKELTRIGDYAFAGSGLKSIKLNLQGSVADSSINTHCFADCKQLSSVEMINSTYLGDHMFDGCDNLVDVKLNNYHSYVNPFAFANCRTLAKIQIPANIYMLSPHMFEGCVNLTSIQFQSGSQLRQLGECVFSGCTKLTTISLPASINDLNYIDPLFLSGSSIQRVEFAGLSDDIFINEVYKKISVDYETHKWYSSPKATVEGLMNTCHKNHLPMIVNLGNSASQCSRCKTWEKSVIDQASWKTWFNNSQYFYVHAMHGIDAAAYYAASGFISRNTKLKVPGTFPRIYVYWNKLNDDGTETLVAYGGDGVKDSDFNVASRLIAKADSTFAGYDGLSSYSYEIKSQITTFGLGTGKKVIYVSSTGKEYECSNDAVEYTPEVKVDKTTTTDFKFGTWYRNAKQLVAAADVAGVPVLAEFGSIGCDPCIDFRKNAFNNQNFQKEVTSLPVLLCKVEIGEGESFDYPATSQAHWISHSFGDPKTYIPQLIFYWNPPASVSTASPYKEIWNYNYRSDAANANYQTVLNKLDIMLNHFPRGKEWLATISSSLEGKTIYSGDIGRYLYYKNEVGDIDGRYFVCDSKTRIQTWNSAVLSIKNEDELTPIRPLEDLEQLCSVVDPVLQDFQLFSSSSFSQPELATYITSGAYSIFNSISENDIVEIAKATYQCFTTTPDIPTSNLSGVIFKVSEMSAVNSRAVVLDGGTWKYADDMSTVDAGDIRRIALKNGVEYLYKFLNEEDDIPDSPKDDDWPLGTWIEATETTSREAFEDIYKDSESDSVVLVIAEDLETSTASATLEDGTSASVQVNLSGVRVDDVEKAAKEAFKKEGKAATSINNLDELRVAASFKMMISEDITFKNWMKRSGYRFLLVRTNDWSKGFPQALRYFEEEVSFEGNKTTDKLPKILVYHGCSTCVISGVALYCRKKIAVDQVRTDSTYYSGLIDAYAELADDYIWYR